MNSLPLLLAAAAPGDKENHLQLTSCRGSLKLPSELHVVSWAAAAASLGCEALQSWESERSREICPVRNMIGLFPNWLHSVCCSTV